MHTEKQDFIEFNFDMFSGLYSCFDSCFSIVEEYTIKAFGLKTKPWKFVDSSAPMFDDRCLTAEKLMRHPWMNKLSSNACYSHLKGSNGKRAFLSTTLCRLWSFLLACVVRCFQCDAIL